MQSWGCVLVGSCPSQEFPWLWLVFFGLFCFCFSRFCFLRINARRFGVLSSRHTPLNTKGVCGSTIKKWPRECREIEVRNSQQHLPPLERLFGGTLALKSKLPCCEEPKPHRKARGRAWMDSARYWPSSLSVCHLLIPACRQGFQLLRSNSRVLWGPRHVVPDTFPVALLTHQPHRTC